MILSSQSQINDKKADLLSLISFIHCIKVPPYFSLLILKLKIQSIGLYIASQSELPRSYQEPNITTLFSLLDIGTIIDLWINIIQETKIIIIANKPNILYTIIDVMLRLIFPFEWHFTIVTCLPKSQLELMEIKTPFIIGVLSHSIDYDNLISKYNECCFVNCNTGEIISKLDMGFPIKALQQAKEKIQYLKNFDLMQENGFIEGESEQITNIKNNLTYEENIREIFFESLNKLLCLKELKQFLDISAINKEIERNYNTNDKGKFINNNFKKKEYIKHVIKIQGDMRDKDILKFEKFMNQLTKTKLFEQFIKNSFINENSPNFESFTKIYETINSSNKPHKFENCLKVEMDIPREEEKKEIDNEIENSNEKQHDKSFCFYSDNGIIQFLQASILDLEKKAKVFFDKIIEEFVSEYFNAKEKMKNGKTTISPQHVMYIIGDYNNEDLRIRSSTRSRRYIKDSQDPMHSKGTKYKIIKYPNNQITFKEIGFSNFCLYYLFYLGEVSGDLGPLLDIYHQAFYFDQSEFPYARYFLLLYKLSEDQFNEISKNLIIPQLKPYLNFLKLLKCPPEKKNKQIPYTPNVKTTRMKSPSNLKKFYFLNNLFTTSSGSTINTGAFPNIKNNPKKFNERMSNYPLSRDQNSNLLSTLRNTMKKFNIKHDEEKVQNKINAIDAIKEIANKIKVFLANSLKNPKSSSMLLPINSDIENLSKISLSQIKKNKPATWLNLFNSLMVFSFLTDKSDKPKNYNDWIEIIEKSSYNIGNVNFKLRDILSKVLNCKTIFNEQKGESKVDNDKIKITFDNINLNLLYFGVYFPIKDDIIAFSIFNEETIDKDLIEKAKTFFDKAISVYLEKIWVNQYLDYLIPGFFENNIFTQYEKYINISIFKFIKENSKEVSIRTCNWEGY